MLGDVPAEGLLFHEVAQAGLNDRKRWIKVNPDFLSCQNLVAYFFTFTKPCWGRREQGQWQVCSASCFPKPVGSSTCHWQWQWPMTFDHYQNHRNDNKHELIRMRRKNIKVCSESQTLQIIELNHVQNQQWQKPWSGPGAWSWNDKDSDEDLGNDKYHDKETCLYSSGFSFENMLWCSWKPWPLYGYFWQELSLSHMVCWLQTCCRMLMAMLKWWFSIVDVE